MEERKKTLKQIIEKIVGDELIEAVVIGDFTPNRFCSQLRKNNKKREFPETIKGKVMEWEKASKLLNYQTDYSYDGLVIKSYPDIHFFTLWTPSKVLFVRMSSDDTVRIVWIPRHPVPGNPSDWPTLELTEPHYKSNK